jgi:hypothetical protein
VSARATAPIRSLSTLHLGKPESTGYRNFRQPKDVPNWIIGANIIDQRSVGSDLFTGSAFQTYQASAKAQMTYAGWTLFVAGSSTGDGSNIFSQFGTKPNYTDMQQVSFDNARRAEPHAAQLALRGRFASCWLVATLKGLARQKNHRAQRG